MHVSAANIPAVTLQCSAYNYNNNYNIVLEVLAMNEVVLVGVDKEKKIGSDDLIKKKPHGTDSVKGNEKSSEQSRTVYVCLECPLSSLLTQTHSQLVSRLLF